RIAEAVSLRANEHARVDREAEAAPHRFVENQLGAHGELTFAEEVLGVAGGRVERSGDREPERLARGVEDARLEVQPEVADPLRAEGEIARRVRVVRRAVARASLAEEHVDRQAGAELEVTKQTHRALELRREQIPDVEAVAAAAERKHAVRQRGDQADRV